MHAPARCGPSGLARRIGVLIAVTILFAVAAPVAMAGTGLSAVPNIPSPNGAVTVGQTRVASSLTVTNTSDDSEGALNVSINPDTIMLEPSCGSIPPAGGACAPTNYDPGVLALSPTGVGANGTACAGVLFTIVTVPRTAGEEYEFREPIGTTIVLGPGDRGGPLATCTINFTVSVLKVPTLDARSDPGIQTDEYASALATAADLQTGGGSGTNFTTVAPAPLPMTTAVSPATFALGGTFQDTATLTPPAGAIAPTGTVTFDVYEPGDATCAGPVLFSSTDPVSASYEAASSAFLPSIVGSYRVVATYSGDADYLPAAGGCNDVGETATVIQATLSIATQVSPATIALGSSFVDTATVTPALGAPAPTGSITFNVYGAGDSGCSSTPVFTSTDTLNAAGTVSISAGFLPISAGQYRVIATYLGDSGYAPFSTSCNDVNETETVIAPPTPTTTSTTPTTPTPTPTTTTSALTTTPTTTTATPDTTGVVKGVSAQRPRLALVKTARPSAVKQGATVTFTLKVTNDGIVSDTHVQVCDVLPAGLTLVTLGHGSLMDGQLCWTVGTLAVGASRTERFDAKIDNGFLAASIVNHAVATATRVSPVRARAVVRVIRVPLPGSHAETVTG